MNLVSGIMPCRGRRDLAPIALQCFLDQTYPHKELVILDDADDPSFPHGVESEHVHYSRLDKRLTIPIKRNMCCDLAKGTYICHFDSDDWSAPNRIADQVSRLEEFGKSLTGYAHMLFYDLRTSELTKYMEGGPNYACGTTLMYRKSWWIGERWDERMDVASDNNYVRRAHQQRQFITELDAGEMMVACIHSNNTSPKRSDRWLKMPQSALPAAFLHACRRDTPTPVGV